MQVQNQNAPQAANRKWTVLVYSAADNNLHDALVQNLKDAERVGSSDAVAIVSQLDHGADRGCDRLLITKSRAHAAAKPEKQSFVDRFLSWFRKEDDAAASELQSPVLEHLGKRVNMSDPKVFADFIEWGMKSYPAEHTLVIVSDHGMGWKGAVQDESEGGWMTLDEIDQGLEMAQGQTGKKIDILGFDACLMASAEVAEKLKDKASFLVASEETEGAAGWQYNEFLTKGRFGQMRRGKDLEVSPEEFARHIVSVSAKHQDNLPTMAAIDNSKVDGVTTAVKAFSEAILSTDAKMGVLRSDARSTQKFYENKDLAHFAELVAKDARIEDKHLKAAAQGVVDAVKEAVIAEEHADSYPGSKGLAVSLGSWSFSPKGAYRELDFAAATGWDKALDRIGKYWFLPPWGSQSTFAVRAGHEQAQA